MVVGVGDERPSLMVVGVGDEWGEGLANFKFHGGWSTFRINLVVYVFYLC